MAFDAGRCVETHSNMKYFNITEMSAESFIINKVDLSGIICVMMFPDKLEQVINLFLTICKPSCIVIVIPKKNKNKTYKKILDGYYVSSIYPKLITCMSAFSQNETIDNSITMIISKKEISEQMLNDVIVNGLHQTGNCFIRNELTNDMRIHNIIIDGVGHKMFPKWIMQISENDKNKVLLCIHKLLQNQQQFAEKFYNFINQNITNLDEFNEYIEWNPHPPINCNHEKFLEYKKFYLMVSS